ncbi:MAG: flagellar motor switch protein FliN [Verrucomicrobiota bacterium]
MSEEVSTEPLDSSIIMNIPVALSVELGRTELQVKELVGLAPGNVVELDRQVNDPVDLYVNGRLIAKGEVVVVDDAIGIKITEVVGKE